MAYRLIVTERAHDHLDNILSYLVDQLYNPTAATHLLQDVEDAYLTLIQNGSSFSLCLDPYLRSKGYRKFKLHRYDYVIIYVVIDDVIRVDGIFHTLEHYSDRL